MIRIRNFFPWGSWAGLTLFSVLPIHAQGGKAFLQWLKEYSPTGYFIINDYETRANKPGDHKQWLDNQTVPFPVVAVHETCHMRDGLNSKSNAESWYVGDGKDLKITANFTPFNSKEMMPDIPASLENFLTDVYISGKEGEDAWSMQGGLLGIIGEFNAYITGLKADVEMAACFKANFNSAQNWNALAGDGTSSIMSTTEFRYFCLRYILWAQKKYPNTYQKIIAHAEIRAVYTQLVLFAEKTAEEWIAVLKAQNLNTTTSYGFDWYWKFQTELQKPEYKELEKIMLITPIAIAPRPSRNAGLAGAKIAGARFDLQGRQVPDSRVVGRETSLGIIYLAR